MTTYFSQENLVNLEPCSSSRLEVDHDRMSFVKLYTGLTKIENLTYRLGYLSSFVSALEETLEFCSSCCFNFRYCSKEIVGLTEAARKTLESEGVVPYLWASCPERLVPHKRAYVQLLQLLHSNERYIAPQLRRRLRALLMPLTSQFSITKNSDWRQQDDWPETPLYRTIHITPGLHGAGRDQRMPPPPAPRTPIFRRRSNCGKALTRSIKSKLWTLEELSPPQNLSFHTKYRTRDRDTVRSWAAEYENENDERDDQENAVPEETRSVIPFRQPRSTLRFGICFNRKSSSQQNGGRLSNAHSLMNYKE